MKKTKHKTKPKFNIDAIKMVRRIRDERTRMFAGKPQEARIEYIRKTGAAVLAEARASKPRRSRRAG